MAETQEGLQRTRDEVKTGQVLKFLQSLDVVFTENRDVLTVLPELIKRFVELESNITKATRTPTSDGTSEFSRLPEEQESNKKKWERQQRRQEKQISRLENELQEAKKTISDLEAKTKQNDNDVEMLQRENRDLSDKNYYKSKYKDLKAKLRTTNEELQAKKEKIVELGRELSSKQEDYDAETHRTRNELAKKEKEIAELGKELRANQEDYDKETQRSRKELAEKEEELAKTIEQLNTIKQQHDESFRDQKTKIDELQARITQLEGELLSLRGDFDKEKQRSERELTEKDKAIHKGKIERERAKQHYVDDLRDKETKLKRSETCNGELTRENDEWRKRFKHQEEQHKSDLSLKEMEVNKLKQRLSHREKEVKRVNEELGQMKSRFAGICEKRVKQDQRKVENILASNQQSEVENDFRDFFDSSREDARDIIQSLYGSEEEIDIHVYYPRIACTILESAYEHAIDAKDTVIDFFKVATKTMVLRAPEMGYHFSLSRTDGSFVFHPISIDDPNTSEISTDVLDALLISLKDTAHICNLECLEKDVTETSWKKWEELFEKDASFELTPTRELLVKLNSYIKACIRLTWRMVTQLPPLRLEYHSPKFDPRIHKKTAYQDKTEKNPVTEESSEEEIVRYLWPGLFDGGDRLILHGQVLSSTCKGKN